MKEPDKTNERSRKIPEAQEFENFRMYHQLQYDRIDKLESKRETFSNLVITVSAGIYLIGFDEITNLNIVTGMCLPIMVIVVNLASIMFANRSRAFVKMHQNRAKMARATYAPQLNDINSKVYKLDSSKDAFRRNRIYKYLHVSIIVIALLSIFSFFQYGGNKTAEEKKNKEKTEHKNQELHETENVPRNDSIFQ